jgi:hypothetical protein
MISAVEAWLRSRPLYCLICGGTLVVKSDELYCQTGNSGYAAFAASCIAEGLNEVVARVEAQEREAPEHDYSCPVCRGAFSARAPRMLCGRCGFRAGSGLWRQLVERTPHG